MMLRTMLQALVLVPVILLPSVSLGQLVLEVGPERSTRFYSSDGRLDCSEFFMLPDEELPYNVVRLRARLDPPVEGANIEWSLPKPAVGFLLADQDLGPTSTAAAVRGFCAEFGNSCILTKDSAKFYDQETVLWAAPTCDILPNNTKKVFQGGNVKIKVRARSGKRTIGKASAIIDYGDPSVASVTLYAFGADGTGTTSVPGGDLTSLNAIPSPVALPGLPAIDNYTFSVPGDSASVPECPPLPSDECVKLVATNPGRILAKVALELSDGSAVCDNLNVRVGSCDGRPKLQITRSPKQKRYAPETSVDLAVSLKNASPRENGCRLRLSGANVLSCLATFKIGKLEETQNTQWDLQHCSETVSQPCVSDADCQFPACGACEQGEQCLTQSHCSDTIDRPCTADAECRAPVCPNCRDNERCIRVLETPEIIVPIGETIDLVREQVTLKNELGSQVKISEVWTVNTFAQGSDEAKQSYRIRNSP